MYTKERVVKEKCSLWKNTELCRKNKKTVK